MQRTVSTPSTPFAYTSEVDPDLAGQRVDNYLLRVLKGVPRAHVYRLIRSGQVRVNGGRVRAGYRLKAGDAVRVPPVRRASRPRAAHAEAGLRWLEERIIYEDQRILVLDKPAGMAAHGGSGIDVGCIEALRCLRPQSQGMDLVHRLDRGTSGCLLVAKRRSALRLLHGLLRDGAMEKRYLALLAGSWRHGSVPVTAPLAKGRRGGSATVHVASHGKEAHTEFHVLTRYGERATFAEVKILTGRTHQIRVHAAHMGHPIAGDPRYGDADFNEFMRGLGLRRIFLHAHALGFAWPDSGEPVMVSSPLPEDLGEVQERLVEIGSE